MKKLYIALSSVLLVSAGASAEYKTGYYDNMNGKSGASLKAAAKECVQKHQTLVYTDLPNYWEAVSGACQWLQTLVGHVFRCHISDKSRTERAQQFLRQQDAART